MATAVGAILARARREVDDLFFDNDAFSPERPVAFEPRMPAQQHYLDRLIAEGTVHESEPGASLYGRCGSSVCLRWWSWWSGLSKP
jgi:hypothetical protein